MKLDDPIAEVLMKFAVMQASCMVTGIVLMIVFGIPK